MLATVVIVGRPNVGKSALFNRLISKRQSLVDETPGITRDRLYGDVDWGRKNFQIVDTGGLNFDAKTSLSEGIFKQVARAMEEADLALFVGDAQSGITPLDREVASWVRQWGKPIIAVANKVDPGSHAESTYEFSALGFGSPVPVSSLHGRGTSELLDEIQARLEKSGAFDKEVKTPKIPGLKVVIVGRPNVGKSSLINRVLKEERVLVDSEPGTTRDVVEIQTTIEENPFSVMDTAGMVSKRRLKERVDAIARIKAMEAVGQAQVCLVMLDASVGITTEDLKLLDQVVTLGKPFCLVVNKWDLLKGKVDPHQIPLGIGRRAPFLRHAPVVVTSAKTGFQVEQAFQVARELAQESLHRVSTSDTKRLLEEIRQDPKAPPGIRHAVWIRVSQVRVAPPTFHLMVRTRGRFRGSDLAYLEKKIREILPFPRVPIRIQLLTKRREKRRR